VLQQRQYAQAGALFAAAVLALGAAASGFVGAAGPGWGRAAWVVFGLGAVAAAVYVAGVRAWRAAGDVSLTARWLGQRLPQLSTDMLAAVELENALRGRPDFSLELAQAFLAQADARAAGVDARDATDRRLVRRARGAFALAATVALISVAAQPRRWWDGQTRVWRGDAKTALADVREPITGDVELEYRYPAYTGLPPRVVTGTSGEISALRGTEVRIKTRADRDVGRADWVINERALPLQVTGGRELRGQWVLEKTGTHHFAFYSSRGRLLATGPDVPVVVQLDAAPGVRLLTPPDELEVDPGQKVILTFEASDDYGLSELALVYRPPRGPEKRVPLPHDEGRRFKGTYAWTLSDLPLHPGDRLSYFLEAKDNDAVDGPQRGVSRTQTLKVYSAAEHRRDAVLRAEQLWERLVTHLAARLEGPDRLDPLPADKAAAQRPLDQSGLDLASDLGTAATDIARQRDAPVELWGALATISESFGRPVRRTAEMRRRFTQAHGAWAASGRELTRAVNDEIRETEHDVLYLEALLDRQKLLELQELARQMEGERRELASLIEQYKKTQDERLKDDILKEADALKRHISELMQRMAELAKGIRDEHVNSEALEQLMRERNMNNTLEDVERLLREGKADEALSKLQQLSMEMEKMVNQLDQAGRQMGEDAFPELAKKFDAFMKDLHRTTEEQKANAEATKALRDRYREQAKTRLKQKGDQVRAELLKTVKEVQRDYKQAGTEQQLPFSSEGRLEQAEEQLEGLKTSLEAEDYDMAAEAADLAERTAAGLALDADEQRQRDEVFHNPPDVRAQSRRRSENMLKNAQKIEDVRMKLEELLPQPGQMVNEEDKQRLRQMSSQQRQLQKRADGLREQMDEMSKLAPVFDPQAARQMEEVGQRMGQAAQRMDQRDPSRGYGEQRAAVEQLEQFERQMSSGQGSSGGGLPLPMLGNSDRGRRLSSHEKVELPDPDQYQAPKEFRKDLLDAMKQGAPDKYKDQVKRYYEELVK